MELLPRIDVVFTDIQLAGILTGWDVAEQFRAANPDLPIIYASGNAVDRSRRVQCSLFQQALPSGRNCCRLLPPRPIGRTILLLTMNHSVVSANKPPSRIRPLRMATPIRGAFISFHRITKVERTQRR